MYVTEFINKTVSSLLTAGVTEAQKICAIEFVEGEKEKQVTVNLTMKRSGNVNVSL